MQFSVFTSFINTKLGSLFHTDHVHAMITRISIIAFSEVKLVSLRILRFLNKKFQSRDTNYGRRKLRNVNFVSDNFTQCERGLFVLWIV